jgi:hypothetical protein
LQRSCSATATGTIVEERQPSFPLDGAVLITGDVDRATPSALGVLRRDAEEVESFDDSHAARTG